MITPKSRSRPAVKTAFPLLFTALCFWLCAIAAGESGPVAKNPIKPYALIYGTVWGPDNRPLFGVKINVRRNGEKMEGWHLYSDHSGEFAQRVPAGRADYTVSADLKGYRYSGGKGLRLEQDVNVHIENDERVDIGLHLTR